MLFNSIDFAVFLPIVFAVYWLLNSHLRIQNLFIAMASYVFYGWWDWRFLVLIFLSSLLDYAVALLIDKETKQGTRKAYLIVSIFANLGLLGFFKYFNFFVDSFTSAFSLFGVPFQPMSLNIVLPVGISFYTFQTMSYTIDVYRRQLTPTRDPVSFFAFVSFFPQLVAGPIERARNLLPQFYVRREFSYAQATDGLRQILWGLFKKLVIADNCAVYTDLAFNDWQTQPGSMLLIGALLFSFQIYCDFSGYSDIAIGTSRLFGFTLTKNFAYPYFSRDLAEFWRRWHISLSTWFRDYLYIPCGGSKGTLINTTRNVLLVFVISGIWHGTNWTFIAWGLIHATFYMAVLLLGRTRVNLDVVATGRAFPTLTELISVLFTFSLVSISWVFFRSDSLNQAFGVLSSIFSPSVFLSPDTKLGPLPFLIAFLVIFEWIGRTHNYAIENLFFYFSRYLRWLFYMVIISLIGLFMATGESPFIYFQF